MNATNDIRNNIRTLNDTMNPFIPDSIAEWETYRAKLIDRIRYSSGIELLRHGAPLNARVFDAVEYVNFTVEKVYFQSLPGFYVTGNLFRPNDTTRKYPAVLNPHGHWKTGRIYDEEDGALPRRCANLAMRGFVAFLYDMIGYNDSCQVPHTYNDIEADMWNIGRFGQQLNNSIKAVDFITSLSYVDSTKIGCTGASGGGTQTFFLTAVDERIKAAAPINMVSGIMQGGCNCENSPNLRTDCCNIDYMSLTAPRDAFMSACDGDWTVNSPESEFVAVREIFELYGAGDKLRTFYQHSNHNYNRPIREHVYTFFCDTFGVENKYDGEVVINIEPEHLLIGNMADIKDAVKGDKEFLQLQKNIISDNLKKLSEDERNMLRLEIFGVNLFGYLDPKDRLIADTEENGVITELHELYENGRTNILYNKIYNKHAYSSKYIVYLRGGDDSGIADFLDEGYSIVIPRLFKEEELNATPYDNNNFYYTYNYSVDAMRVCDLYNLYVYFEKHLTKLPEITASGKYAALCSAALPLLGDAKLNVYPKPYTDEKWWLKELYIPGMMYLSEI